MNTTTTDQSTRLIEGLQKAMPIICQPGDFLNNLEASLKIIADTFSNDRAFILTHPQVHEKSTVLEGVLFLEKKGDDWQEKVERSPKEHGFYLQKNTADQLQAGKSVAGTYSSLFSQIPEKLDSGDEIKLTLLPLLSDGTLKGVLGLGCQGGLCEKSPLKESIILTYTNTLGNWINQHEIQRFVQKERDQFRDIVNFGFSGAIEEADLPPDWKRSITDAQLLNRKITTTIPDQIFIIDLQDQSNLYSNRPVFLGYELKNIDNPFEFFQKLIHPEDLGPAFESFFEKLMSASDEDMIESEYRMFTKSGEVVWFNERVKVFKRDKDGQVWQYLNILQDITQRKLALQKEAESQQRYRNFVTYSGDGIYYMHCPKPIDIRLSEEEQQQLYYDHAYIKEANPAIAKMYNLDSEQELIGATILELHQGPHFERNKESFLDLVRNNYRVENIETIEQTKDGKRKYFLNHAVGSIVDNKLIGVWGTQQDITTRKEAELARLESEMFFRSLYEKNPLGVSISDANGNVLRLNDRFTQLLGFSIDELKGKTLFAITEPDDVLKEVSLVENAVAEQWPFAFIEKRYLHKNGQTIWVNLSMSFLYKENGQLHSIISMIEDITEKRKFRFELEQKETFQKAILNTLPDLKFRISKEGYYLDYYPSPDDSKDLYVSPDDFLGKQMSEVIPAYIANAVLHNVRKALTTKEVQEFEYALPVNGKLSHYEIRTNAINDEEVIAVVRNVSERNWAQNELKDRLKELDEANKKLKAYIDSNMQLENFAYIASHDLREPLRTMSTFAQLLQKRYGDQLDETANSYIDFVVGGAKNMDQLIKDLLAYSRIETQENPRVDIPLLPLLQKIKAGLKDTIEENQAEVSFKNIPPLVRANPSRITQLIQNLLANAIKFRKPDVPPIVSLECADLGKFWQFRISDNGIGINPDFHDKIFLLFKKLHSSKDFKGTGLGLAICKKVVEQHGGEIWIESVEGEGSAFIFTIKKDGGGQSS